MLVGAAAADERRALPEAAAGLRQRQPEGESELRPLFLPPAPTFVLTPRVPPPHALSQDFLLQIFTVFRILIRPEMFPKDWTVMRLVTNK